jgi:hypothetical protein
MSNIDNTNDFNDDEFDDEDYQEDNGDRLDGEYIYPNAQRLLEVAASMDDYDNGVKTREAIGIKDDHNVAEKHNMATELCNHFAELERTVGDPGMIMMMYEGMIFKMTYDLRLQTISKNKYKELAKFFMVGTVVMLGVAVYTFLQ